MSHQSPRGQAASLAIAIAVLCGGATWSSPPQVVLRSGVDVVVVECSVLDRSGRPVEDLQTADFEWQPPTFIRQNGVDVPVEGSFWIDPRRGDLVQSLLTLQSGRVGIDIRVLYLIEPATGVVVPKEIVERYSTDGAVVEFVARLGTFRMAR